MKIIHTHRKSVREHYCELLSNRVLEYEIRTKILDRLEPYYKENIFGSAILVYSEDCVNMKITCDNCIISQAYEEIKKELTLNG